MVIQRDRVGEDERDKMSSLGLIDGEGPSTPFLSIWRNIVEGEQRDKREKRDSRKVEGDCIIECVSKGSNGMGEGGKKRGGKSRD